MLVQGFDLLIGRVKLLPSLKLVLLSFVDFLENDLPLKIEILAGRVMEESLSLTQEVSAFGLFLC